MLVASLVLESLAEGEMPDGLMSFEALRERVGFDAYDAELDRYRD